MPEWIRNPDPAAQKPRPGKTLLASARRLTKKKLTERRGGITSRKQGASHHWQDDAWDMYDLVGEQRFLASTLANRLAQARLYVGIVTPDSQTDDPVHLPGDHRAVLPLMDLDENSFGLQQLLYRMAINLYVAGEGWLIENPDGSPDDMRWHMCSVDEVSTIDGMVHASISEDETLVVDPDEAYVIRIWRPHPRWSWEADASTRASLPVLRELVGLTMHISAQVDSRLAGAGLLIVPNSAKQALAAASTEGDDDSEFIDALMTAMLTPISDRGSASALVPLVVTVPDEAADKFNHLTFARELDAESRELRDEAIRRLALGQDAPPEVLLGTGNMNHWGAYLVQEDVVTTHLEPPLALICDALTSQYLRPELEAAGLPNPEQYVIWYDVSHLVVRPNRSSEAVSFHERGVISDAALRNAGGYDDSDAPQVDDSDHPVYVQLALDSVRSMPSLLADPGLPRLVEQIREVLENPQNVVGTDDETDGGDGDGGLPPIVLPNDRSEPSKPIPDRVGDVRGPGAR